MYNRTLEERIAAKVERNADGCLVWVGSQNGRGYGQIWRDDRVMPSHRAVWEIHNGPIPNGMLVDHLCHNRSCCEITHLRLATDAINKQNRAGPQVNSALGIRGVHILPSGKYKARVQKDGISYYSVPLDTIEEAEQAAIALRAKHHDPIPEITT